MQETNKCNWRNYFDLSKHSHSLISIFYSVRLIFLANLFATYLNCKEYEAIPFVVIALESNWKLQKLSGTTFASASMKQDQLSNPSCFRSNQILKSLWKLFDPVFLLSPSVQSLCLPCHLTETNGKQNSYIWRWNLLFPGKFTFTESIKLLRQS